MKRAVWIISGLLTIIISMVYFYFQGSLKINSKNDLLSYVSENNAIILKIKYENDLSDIMKDNENIPSLFYSNFIQEVMELNDVLNRNEALQQSINAQDIFIASQKLNAKTAGTIYFTSLKDFSIDDAAVLFNSDDELVTKAISRAFEGENIYHFERGILNYYYVLKNDYLIISKHPTLIEDALRTKSNSLGLSIHPIFVKWQEQQQKSKSIMYMYINHKALNEFYSLFFQLPLQNAFYITEEFADFTCLELNYKSDAWILNGEIEANEKRYFHLLKSQTENRSYLCNFVSSNVWAIQNLILSDANLFRIELQKQNILNKKFYYDAESKLINKKYNIDLKSLLNEYIGNEIVVAYNSNYSLLNHSGYISMMVINQPQDFVEKMDKLNKKQLKEVYKNIEIKSFPLRKILYLSGGEPFQDLESNYYILIDDRLMMSSTILDLKKYIDDFQTEQLLKNKESFQNYIGTLNDQYNYLFYVGISGYEMGVKPLLKDKASVKLIDRNGWLNYSAFSYQVTSSDAGLISSIYMPMNNEENVSKLEEKWQISLDGGINSSAAWIKLIGKNENLIFVQDVMNKIYLIDEASTIKWRKNIDQEIISEIKTVDYYKNGETQILFNTRNYIYLMDLNGNFMPNYPLKLSSEANRGLSLFDYDKDKNYRIFISCDNQCVYVYDVSGRPLDGWNPKRIGNVIDEIQHIRVKGKDLLFIPTSQSYFYFLNRKGEIQAQFKDSAGVVYHNPFYFDENEDFSRNRFVSTDQYGKIKSIFIDGHRLYKSVGTWTENHFFMYADVLGDTKKDYVFIDNNQLMVYQDDTTLGFNYQFNASITDRPFLLKYQGDENLLGVFSKETQQIFIFDRTGKLQNGFPLKASSKPSFVINSEQKKMIIGTNEGRLIYYLL